MPDLPSLSDGSRGITDPIVENLNVLVSSVPLKYIFLSDTFKVAGRVTQFDTPEEGVILGMDIRSTGPQVGGLNVQLKKATDVVPLPAHTIKITKGTGIKYYGVTDGDNPNQRNAPVRITPTLQERINPFFQGLLSSDLGDAKQQSYSIATMGVTETITTNPQNHRSGATKAYAATLSDGSALPAGVAINASTGVITVTKASVVAGVYNILVTASDTLATLPADHEYYLLEGIGTLYLTITA
jgi:hypothetical protein